MRTPKSTIWVHATEFSNARGEAGLAAGYLAHHFPRWLAPRTYEFADGALGPFARSQKITRAGDVRVVPTPGHTPGHVSVVVVEDEMSTFIAGDATYAEGTLLDEAVDGVSPDEAVALGTIRAIESYLRATPSIYLPSHDEHSVSRLHGQTVTRPT